MMIKMMIKMMIMRTVGWGGGMVRLSLPTPSAAL